MYTPTDLEKIHDPGMNELKFNLHSFLMNMGNKEVEYVIDDLEWVSISPHIHSATLKVKLTVLGPVRLSLRELWGLDQDGKTTVCLEFHMITGWFS